MLFAAGVSLIYIPAGVKLLSLLIGGGAAFVGLLASSLYLNLVLWTSLPLQSAIYFAAIGVGSYALAVHLCRRLLKIEEDLSNLSYWHIVVLSVTASLFNGFGQNFVYYTQGVTADHEIFSKSTAMAFGDFFGCFLIVMLFNLGIRFSKNYRPAPRATKR